MNSTQRLKKIGEMLRTGKEVTIPELSVLFKVSKMTIRRDLDSLAASGMVSRTHGGAISTERMAFEFDFGASRQSNRVAKIAIASMAEKLIPSGQRIILDTGTTTLELAHLLRERTDLTVLTPSLAIASELHFSDGINTVLLGGTVRKGRSDLTGMVAEAVLDMFSADIAFQGVDGVGLDGALYTSDMQVAAVDKKIRSRAKSTYVLADSSKIGKTALARHGFMHDLAGLITDDGISDENRKHFEKLGTELIVVKTK